MAADLEALLRSHPAFLGVPLPRRRTGLGLGRWGRHQVLFRQGEASVGLILLLEGRVRVSRMAPDGRRHVLHEEGPGGSLGEVPLFAEGGMAGTATALEPTSGLTLTPDLVRGLIEGSPELALRLLQRMAGRIRGLADRLEQITTRKVQARLAAFLLQRVGRAAGPVFSLGTTHRELADELGSVREVVVRELRALCRGGVLSAEGGGRYRVVDLERLRTLAD